MFDSICNSMASIFVIFKTLYLTGRNFAGINVLKFFFGHFAEINFRESGLTEDFGGINFRKLSLTKNFAELLFAKAPSIKISRE